MCKDSIYQDCISIKIGLPATEFISRLYKVSRLEYLQQVTYLLFFRYSIFHIHHLHLVLNMLHIFFKKKLGFTRCKAEQPLQGMELQEKETQKD